MSILIILSWREHGACRSFSRRDVLTAMDCLHEGECWEDRPCPASCMGTRGNYLSVVSGSPDWGGRTLGMRQVRNRSNPSRPVAWEIVTGEPLTPQKVFSR